MFRNTAEGVESRHDSTTCLSLVGRFSQSSHSACVSWLVSRSYTEHSQFEIIYSLTQLLDYRWIIFGKAKSVVLGQPSDNT